MKSKTFPSILVSLLLHLSLASSYTLPDYYFINCGSASTRSVYQLNFTGDENPANHALSSASGATTVSDQTLSADELYQTARIFTKPSSYELDLDQDGIYVVRLHFFHFPAVGNLSDARFTVAASGFSLRPDFSSRNSTFPLVEELLINLKAGRLKIELIPDGKPQSFAFINAVEAFVAPSDFVRDSPPPPRVTPEGGDGNYVALWDSALRLVHRINVGGANVKRETDTMKRFWSSDDPYLLLKNTGKNSPVYTDKINYQSGGSTRFDAPESVYSTAKEMNINSNDSNALSNFNVTWRFDVRANANHLVRFHFCDIVSRTTNEWFKFNLFIYNDFSKEIYPWNVLQQNAAPFYMDFVVHSDHSGFMDVKVGPNRDSEDQTAWLNGLEIMELLGGEVDPSSDHHNFSKKYLPIIIGSLVGGVVSILALVALIMVCLQRRKMKGVDALDWPLTPFNVGGGSSHSRITVRTSVTGSPFADLNLGLKIPLSHILFATRQFDSRLMIGEGGFGKVYKGTLRSGTKVAIKRSEPGNAQGQPEFHTEIMVLSKIRYQHLVSLIGYCDEKNEMILVYEFMEKGTLREHLYTMEGEGETKKPNPTCKFSWDQRLNICIGAARGLHYLHTGSNGTIIHRDIKSTNILLDEHYVAKVADFGLSRLGPRDQSHVSTEVKGSFGYLDPEYFRCLQLTQKSDVYSFGVVLLEVLCARPAVDPSFPREQVNLADWGLSWQRKGQLEEIADPFLAGKVNPNSLRKFGETVDRCLRESGDDRPKMVDVLWDLEYSLQLQHSAVPRQPYEDSTTEVSWALPLPVVQRLPSHSLAFDEDEDELQHESFVSSVAGSSQLNASEVFSQLNMDGAR